MSFKFYTPLLMGIFLSMNVESVNNDPHQFFPFQTIPALDKYRWQNRILLNFSHANDWPPTEIKRVIQDNKVGILERDLLTGFCRPDGDVWRCDLSNGKEHQLTLMNFVLDKNKHMTVLIGKDGDIKYQKESDFNLMEIFTRIDAMPMRKAEIRRGGKSD